MTFKNVKVVSTDDTLLDANLTFDPMKVFTPPDPEGEIEAYASKLLSDTLERLRHIHPEKTLYLYVDGELKSTLEAVDSIQETPKSNRI